MPAGFDIALARVKALVADFRANEKFYLSPAYQEQEARRDFIDKFWLALGWDVNHETQKNPFEQEVKVERGLSLSASTGEKDGVRCRNSQRRADYPSRRNPNRGGRRQMNTPKMVVIGAGSLIRNVKHLCAAQMNKSIPSMIRQRTLVAMIMVQFMVAPNGWTSSGPSDAIQSGRTFLVNLLDPDLGLLHEYRGANVYWLFHDNYLAAKVLAASHPNIAQTIMAAIHREGVYTSGRIQAVFGESAEPLPFREHQLKDVRRAGNKVIRTEVATGQLFDGWEKYADLLFLACLTEKNQTAARQHWEAAMRMWDGKGFLDAAARHDQRYSTYKLGLALLAASHLSPPAEPPQGLLDKLLALQDDSGGWITDYYATGKKLGVANVETTCLTILGIEAYTGHKQSPAK